MTAKEKFEEIYNEREKAQKIIDAIVDKYPFIQFMITDKPKPNSLSFSINIAHIEND